MKTNFTLTVFFALFSLMIFPTLLSQSKPDGWEDGSKFNKLFDTSTVDTVLGEVVQVDNISPLKGMEIGVRVLVKIKNVIIPIFIAPYWFAKHLNITIRPLDQIEVTGSFVRLDGKAIILASRVVCNGIILQLRNDKGLPIWECMRQLL